MPAPALEERLREIEKRLTHVEEQAPEDRVALVVFSGDRRSDGSAPRPIETGRLKPRKVKNMLTWWSRD